MFTSLVFETARAANYPIPPDTLVVTPGGVDMRTGHYVFKKADLLIGNPSAGGLEFVRQIKTSAVYALNNPGPPFGQFSHNWIIRVTEKQHGCCGYDVSVAISGVVETYYTPINPDHVTFQPESLGGSTSTLTRTATGGGTYYYTFRTSGGRVITFSPTATGAGASASTISLADGTVYTLAYDASQRLAQVVSNAGYALILEYNPASGASDSISKACALNLTTLVLPGAFACPAGALSVTYTYQGAMMSSATDPVGAVAQITSTYVDRFTSYVERFINAGETQPYLVNTYYYDPTYGRFYITDQAFSDGHTYHYDWTEVGNGDPVTGAIMIGTGYTDNAGNHTTFNYQFYQNILTIPPALSSGPAVVTDPLNRTTYFGYDGTFTRVISRTLPSSMVERYTYDTWNNVKQKRIESSTGSPSPIIVNATYDCTTLVACPKPTSVTDALNNVTNYTYDPTHGGVLTELLPADVNNIRPVKRYAYAQRYAWITNGAGYVHASSPLWVRTEERTCRTTATVGNACAGGVADEVVTSFDYGPDAGPNNLLLRGVVVTADGQAQRTCYAYDQQGNRISETKPRAGLGSCP